ncbi:MAG: dienelactone hydrolase family protein, partial [Dehalococcoidia bacterium]
RLVLLVVGGPANENEGFRAAFGTRISSPAALTLIRAATSAPSGAAPPTTAPAPPATATPAGPPASTAPVVGTWTKADPPRGAPAGGEWIAIAAPEGRTILARVSRPTGTGPFPAVVPLHSQTGFSTEYLALGDEIARAGFVTVTGCWFGGHYDGTATVDPPPALPLATGVDCPNGPAIKPITSGASLEDIAAIVAATKTLPGVRAERIGVVGNSRGSIVALLGAAVGGNVVQAVVGIGGAPPGGPTLAANMTTPVLLLQGGADSVVPVIFGQALEQALIALGRTVESHTYEGAGHGILFGTPTYDDAVQRTVTFLRKHLGA